MMNSAPMTNSDKQILSLLGLGSRGGRISSGQDTLIRDIKAKRVALVIIAGDASDNTRKLYMDKCKFRGVEFIELSTGEALGGAIGKGFRAAIGIKDTGLADKINSYLK